MGVCGGSGVDFSFWLFLHVVLYVNGMVQTPVSHLAAPFE